MRISPSHPRVASLKIRERLVWGVKKGITSTAGLLAHGRGEAFDYLLGEKTHDFAHHSIETAAAYLILARKPVISVNGNTVVLCGKELISLARLLNCKIEVNLFHYTKKRIKIIEKYLSKFDSNVVLKWETNRKMTLLHIASPRKIMLREGIGSADVVFVPLEDGDRTETLVKLGKKVITVDLNPLSRTAQFATVTIVDNIVRTIPHLVSTLKKMRINYSKYRLQQLIYSYKNKQIIARANDMIRNKI